MSLDIQSGMAVSEVKRTRIGSIVRWAARVTSVPVLAMVLTSLIPAVGTFTITPREDKITALALAGTFIGLLAGWRWAGLGGGLTLCSVAVMLAQGDDWRYPDPYCVAFGLQAVLFVVSGMLNWSRGKTVSLGTIWMKKATIGFISLCALAGVVSILRGAGPVPIPKDKEQFVGLWDNGAGFSLEINSDGHAKIIQGNNYKVEPWNSPFAARGTNFLLAYFRGDEGLELTTGIFGTKKLYRIDRPPHRKDKQVEMSLNGSDPYKLGSGVALVRKSPP